jgi:hypothetical protein
MKVFWSWQNDYAPKACRHFIREALVEATAQAGHDLGLEDAERPEVDHDTKGASGMVDIIATIFDKVSSSAVFVADVTPVGKTESGKALPNPNVLIELGWALGKLGADRIIAILNTASGYQPDDLPFDIRNRRALPYELAEDADSRTRKSARKQLVHDLTEALRANLRGHIETKTVSQDVTGVPARSDDHSIWASASERLEYYGPHGYGQKNDIALPKCPRGYIRVIPAGWKDDCPTVNDVARLPQELAVGPPDFGNVDFGTCEEGYVRLMLEKCHDGKPITRNVTMYFDQTGEFWTLHGTAIDKSRFGLTLRNEALVRGWFEVMKRALVIFSQFNALPPYKIEAGLAGVRGVRWHGNWESESPAARKDYCVEVRQQRDWHEEAQINFVTDAYNKVLDLFALRGVSADAVRALMLNVV